jgi:ssDNA-binding Zn-finger/Zn-ribbon topoisomerase 1
MAMSDTAEYWFNKNSFHMPNMFRHGKGIECGHNHNIMDTEYIEDVDCYACKKLIQEGVTTGMLEGKAPEMYYMSNSEKKRYKKQKRFIEENGKCPCGCNWQIRKNRTNGQEFLGCTNYPTCKNTKALAKKVLIINNNDH